jgi:hypothetical protein
MEKGENIPTPTQLPSDSENYDESSGAYNTIII